MFEDLYDAVSQIFSHWWPQARGEITAIDVERVRHSRGSDTLRLAVTYKFSLGSDGPYTGESFWQPPFLTNKRVAGARHKLRLRQSVNVRYRSDDPSVNRLDHEVWQDL
jgi:hypothetical protein